MAAAATARMISRPAWSPFTRATRARRVGGLQALDEAAVGVAVEGRAERGQAAHGVGPFAR